MIAGETNGITSICVERPGNLVAEFLNLQPDPQVFWQLEVRV